jgi:hypothetical protein
MDPGSLRRRGGHGGRCGRLASPGEEAVDVSQSRPGADVAPVDAASLAGEEAVELDLELRRRAEGGGPALAGRGVVSSPVPPERGLSEPGARRNDCSRPLGIRGARVQNAEVVVAEREDAPRVRLDVVDENHLAQADLPFQHHRVDLPWKVDPRHAAAPHDARDPERGASRSHGDRREKRLDQLGRVGELGGGTSPSPLGTGFDP